MHVGWSGKDWQAYCRQLCALRHGADYQAVPDTVGGDWGIEGFTSAGLAYQCYAPKEPLSTRALYEKQRDKITADLAKLRKYNDDVASLVAPHKIHCWILLVPRIEDKSALKFAAEKAQQVLTWELSCASPGFIIRILTPDDFPAERQRLGASATQLVPHVAVGDDDEIVKFAEDHSIPVTALDEKLARLSLTAAPEDIALLRREFLRHYVVGLQLDQWIRRHFPPQWEKWQHGREAVKRTLTTNRLIDPAPPHAKVTAILDQLSRAAAEGLPALDSTAGMSLAYGTVADWLVECPLDFPEARSA